MFVAVRAADIPGVVKVRNLGCFGVVLMAYGILAGASDGKLLGDLTTVVRFIRG